MYDLIVIGGGWAGFNAALQAKKLGLSVCLIEQSQVGGTCLNRGCIPTKSLIHSAPADFNYIQQKKEELVRQLRRGMEFMLKGVDFINSRAEFLSDDEILAADKRLKAKAFLIATGSRPAELNDIRFDGTKVVSSDQLLELKEIPSSLLVIGAGAIGCEFAALFSRLGSQISIAEKMPYLLPGIDRDISKKLEGIFKKAGIKVITGCSSGSLNLRDYGLVLLSVGRKPVVDNLGLEKTGVRIENGAIAVDDYLRTSVPHIYAAGDCTCKIMLAHFAAYQGRIAAQNSAKQAALQKADNYCVPNCIFTRPEIAAVGLSEEEARAESIAIEVHKFDFLGSAMARILGEAEGFFKIISEVKTGRIIGASLIGPRATEIIGILALAVSMRIKAAQLRGIIFAHPTISEAISEALNSSPQRIVTAKE